MIAQLVDAFPAWMFLVVFILGLGGPGIGLIISAVVYGRKRVGWRGGACLLYYALFGLLIAVLASISGSGSVSPSSECVGLVHIVAGIPLGLAMLFPPSRQFMDSDRQHGFSVIVEKPEEKK